MTQSPLVSIVVPSLNRARFLVSTLESILRQDYPRVECVVVDGGSHDASVEILQHYGDRIKWVSEPDEGHADAVNKGWAIAKGEIITWLNADDCYAVPHAIRQVVECFRDHPDADVIYGDYKLFTKDGEIVSGVMKPRKWDMEYAIKHCFYTIAQPASFIKRSTLEKVGGLDTEIGNNIDHELWLRIGVQGKIQHVPVFLAYHRCCRGRSQLESMARAKVRTNEKILNDPRLPSRLRSRSFRRRALSNAHLAGAICGLTGRYYLIFASYLLRALAIDPLNFPYVTWKTVRALVSFVLPRRVKWFLRNAVTVLQGKWSTVRLRPDAAPFDVSSSSFPGLGLEMSSHSGASAAFRKK